MNLTRQKYKSVAVSSKNFKDLADFIRVIVDIYSSSEVNREYWLTEREKDFFVSTVIHVLNGIDNPISKEALQIYKNNFNPATKNHVISDYINKCRKKGWVKYEPTEKRVEIPPMFYEINVDKDVIEFNLSYEYRNGSTD